MEAILFVGLPGSGKSSFYRQRFFQTHVRISLDLLKTRHRANRMLELCLETDQRFAVDNTNPTRAERSMYLEAVKAARLRYSIVGYYFESKVEDCLLRNAQRPEAERVPEVAIYATAKKLELPALEEGFDRLYYVRLREGGFVVEDWNDAI
jgi:predicted kinase